MQNGGSLFLRLMIALVFLSLYSCGRKNNNARLSVMCTEALDTLARIDGEVHVQDICVEDSLIVLLTSGNPMLYVLDKNAGSILKKTGFVGHASNEYFMTPHSINVRNHQVQFMDRGGKQMCYISLSDFSQKKREMPYTADFRPSRAVDIDGNLICVGSLSHGRIGVVSANGGIGLLDYDYPYDTGEVEGIYRGTVFQSEIRVPSSAGQCLVYSFASDSFEMYKCVSGTLERTYTSPVNYAPAINKSGSRIRVDHNRSKAGIIHSAVTDSSVFLMTSELSYNEAAKSGFIGDRITEFRWDGSRKADYSLPVKASGFCADREYFYVICEDNDGSAVIRVPRMG